jgi:hypothetical protein
MIFVFIRAAAFVIAAQESYELKTKRNGWTGRNSTKTDFTGNFK